MGEPGTKEILSLEELDAVAGLRTGRKHVLSILVENKPGVLTRIAGLFARRGFNIDTLTVGPTDEDRLSRITLTVDGALHPIDQVTKQLHKLVNVLKIRDLEPSDTVARELALFKVAVDGAQRAEVMQICEIFRGKVVDVTKRSIILEITGTTEKVEAFERMVRPFGLIEMARTGEVAITRANSIKASFSAAWSSGRDGRRLNSAVESIERNGGVSSVRSGDVLRCSTGHSSRRDSTWDMNTPSVSTPRT
jgi:acetolactate synthase-1/3 small subunit